ncbi:MAG: RluA family pseudouridine synthase [Acidobacteria bacterium]|nr:RluA family pseudouridine synthase [Acidobacteriota bacterium]
MINNGYIYTDTIRFADEGRTVVDFYTRHYRHSPAETWWTRILAGQIRLNGRPASPAEILQRGDHLTFHRPPWEEPDVPTDVGLLFADDDLLALAKPAGLPVLPGGGFLDHTLLHLARRRFGEACSPVHRLGRGTSGVILFARHARAASRLGRALQNRQISKIYLALATGTDLPAAFTVDAPIGPVPHSPLGTVHAWSPAGRPAFSLVRLLSVRPGENASLVEVTIITGRPHQIRIHLSHAGYPLMGDPLYEKGGLPRPNSADTNSPALPGTGGYYLHAWKIRFPHPTTDQDMEIVASPPPGLNPASP